MARPTVVRFRAGGAGGWAIERIDRVSGDGLQPAPNLDVVEGRDPGDPAATWELTGVTSNERYAERAERAALTAVQQGLGRPDATCAALIPIRKAEAWWELPQDERRAIVEQRSHGSLETRPAVPGDGHSVGSAPRWG